MAWSELDLDGGLWTMPQERNKGGRRHIVPLSEAAVGLLRPVPRMAGSRRRPWRSCRSSA